MRLWHKDLIHGLPRKQLLAQWRECCLIMKNIAEKGEPNHMLVNKIMDYPINHFYTYAKFIKCELNRRGYKCDFSKFLVHYGKYVLSAYISDDDLDTCHLLVSNDRLFEYWHNNRYLYQCYFNLQEKYDCGGISDDEWLEVGLPLREV